MKHTGITGRPSKIKFTATLYASDGWVCLDLPRDSSVKLGSRSRIPVIGTLNGYPIRTSVFPTGESGHFMLVNKEMQSGAKAGDGDRVEVVLQVDTTPRRVELPVDLRGALSRSKEAKDVFERLSYTRQREYISWIEEAKRPETRAKRIEQTLTRLTAEKRKKESR